MRVHLLPLVALLAGLLGCDTGAQDGPSSDGQPKDDANAQAVCPDIPAKGCCNGPYLLWCDSGIPRESDCGSVHSCGWNSQFGEYDCGTDGQSEPSGVYPWACPGAVRPPEDFCDGEEDGSPCGDGNVCYQDLCCDRSEQCSGNECGSDGCGGQCGECFDGVQCIEGECVESDLCELTISVSGPGGYIPEAVIDNLESCLNFLNMFCNNIGNICSWDCWDAGAGGRQGFQDKCNSGLYTIKDLLLLLIDESNDHAPGCITTHGFEGDCDHAPEPFFF